MTAMTKRAQLRSQKGLLSGKTKPPAVTTEVRKEMTSARNDCCNERGIPVTTDAGKTNHITSLHAYLSIGPATSPQYATNEYFS
jgi:hypothetical protein